MKHPQYMTYVLDAAALVVVGINLPFALYGYFLFGSETKGKTFFITKLLQYKLTSSLSFEVTYLRICQAVLLTIQFVYFYHWSSR